MPKAKHWLNGRQNWRKKLQDNLAQNPLQKPVWIHCSSLGEFEQGRPLIEKIKQQYPEKQIVLSFFSPSGYQIRKDYEHADLVIYLPLDGRKNANDFIRLINPSFTVFVKYEFWYYYLYTLRQNNIRTILISATFRPSQIFFKWYGGLYRKMLRCFTNIFVQDNSSEKLLESIGIQNIFVTGDTRYDRVLEIAEKAVSIPLVEKFASDSKIIVAGSTYYEDEIVLKDVLKQLPENWKLIIAPHNIDTAHIQQVKTLFYGESILYSELYAENNVSPSILIIDNIGMLSALYHYAQIAYVGGGFRKEGIHNIQEPAAYGLPIIFGPFYKKFVEAKELVARQYAYSVISKEECAEQFLTLCESDVLRQKINSELLDYMHLNKGATEKVMKQIQPYFILQDGY